MWLACTGLTSIITAVELLPSFLQRAWASCTPTPWLKQKGFLGFLPIAHRQKTHLGVGLGEQAGCHKVVPKVGIILGVSVVHHVQGCLPSPSIHERPCSA